MCVCVHARETEWFCNPTSEIHKKAFHLPPYCTSSQNMAYTFPYAIWPTNVPLCHRTNSPLTHHLWMDHVMRMNSHATPAPKRHIRYVVTRKCVYYPPLPNSSLPPNYSCKNGFAISIMPSHGQTKVTAVPRQTMSPNCRFSSEDMITQRINTHLVRTKRATVSVGNHLGDGRSVHE